MQERSQKLCDILKFIEIVVLGKNCIKHPKITKYHQDLYMLLTINAKNADLLYILRLLLQEIFFCRKTQKDNSKKCL